MSSNSNSNLSSSSSSSSSSSLMMLNRRGPLVLTDVHSLEVRLLNVITLVGCVINVLTMFLLLVIPSYRLKSSCFLFHHCLICLTLSILCFPYSLSYSHQSIRCDYLGNIHVTCVTAQLLNMAAMVASEAYRFEDLIHQETSSSSSSSSTTTTVVCPGKSSCSSPSSVPHYFEYELKERNESSISCGCLSFGILIIWFSSVILHLGITMIGTESKSFYDESGQLCNFIITDIRGYVLTLMWIMITIFSLLITIRYIHKILKEVSLKRRTNQPLLCLSLRTPNHGESIASRDILMQQIEERIQLNIVLIVVFILFWFPLFLVTLSDIKFKIPPSLLRSLLLLAWSNSSFSPLTYLLLFPKCFDFSSSFCWKRDRSTTYDSLTSYYNRIGDRFHDIGKWDQYQRDERTINPPLTTTDGIHSNSHSLIVKEISSTNQFSNGLLVTSTKRVNH